MTPDGYVRRVLIAVGVTLAALTAVLLLWFALPFVLLLFAGVLLAVLLNGLSDLASRRTGLPYGLALAGVVLALLAALVGLGWLAGPDLGAELAGLAERVPRAAADVTGWLEGRPWGRALLARLPESVEGAGTTPADLLGRITGIFSTTAGAALNVLIVLFLGLYLAVEPGVYRGGLLRLVPEPRRGRASEVLDALERALRRWLVGRFASMAVVALLTAGALLVLGMPLVLALAALAGLLSFVPVLGPLAAALPAALVAWGEGGPGLAWKVALAYWIVQLVESYLITPLIQRWAVSMPPALLIAAQILLGLAAGVLGVLLATPLAVVAVVLVQTLYVKGVLDDDITPLGA